MTNEYKVFVKQRKVKQIIMGGVFLIIIAAGWMYPFLGYFIPLCMLLGVGIGILRGRKWCDFYCPRGSFFDSLIKPISPQKEIPVFMKRLPFKIGVLFSLMIIMTLQIIRLWPDPYKIGMLFIVLLTVTTILGIILAFIFHQRVWCCFCPVGTMAGYIGKSSLQIKSDLCTECKLCYKGCPIQTAPYKFKKTGTEIVKDDNCLKCSLCVAVCPAKALNIEK